MKIAVTAAAGRLGRAILSRLPARAGAGNVVAVVRDPDGLSWPGVEVRQGDYAAGDGMAAAFEGVDCVLMISAPVRVGTDRVALHRSVIAAARRTGVRRLLYTSIIGNGGETATLFAPTQRVNRQTEADLRDSGLDWCIGRNPLYLDLDLVQVRAAASAGGVYSNPAGEGRAPYMDIAGIARAWTHLAVDARHDGQVCNVGGECFTQAEIVAAVGEVFGLDVRYAPVDDEVMIARFRALMPERGDEVARMLTGCFQCIRNGAFDVPGDHARITGQPAPTLPQMLVALRDSERAGSSSL